MANTVGKYAKAAYPVGSYAGGRVMQAAIGTHTQVADSAAADTIDICKLPGRAQVIRATTYVNGVAAAVADVTMGYVGAANAFAAAALPVTLNSPDDVVVRLTSVGAADFPTGANIYTLIEYLYDQPKP